MSKKQEEEKLKMLQARQAEFLAEFRKLEEKYRFMFRPIITQDGPRMILQELPVVPVNEKPYVTTSEQSTPGTIETVPEK